MFLLPLVGSVLAGFVTLWAFTLSSAPQQAAGFAMALALAVVPYVFARSMEKLSPAGSTGTLRCPLCRERIDRRARRCPHCTSEIEVEPVGETKAGAKSPSTGIRLVVALFLALLAVYALTRLG